MNKKLNTFTLSGLIIGPILGSGVILLPPLLFDIVGNYSLFIWMLIAILGFIFALIFGQLAILFPGDGGVSLATKEALGKKYQLLTSFYLIFAVFFGPVAVLLTASSFIEQYFIDTHIAVITFWLYIFTYLLLTIRIDFLGKLMLFVTSLATIVFLISSVVILMQVNDFVFTIPTFNLQNIGYSFLLVFWAIVGWEVIGNYSADVEDTKTITNAVIFSAIIVSFVYILLSAAICFGDFEDNKGAEVFKLVWIIEPIFKQYSNMILIFITLFLCVGAIILFIGGVARLISSLKLTTYTSKHINSGAPIGALNFLAIIHMITLAFIYFDIFNVADLVAFADGFFIANAIIGLITAIILFENGILKYSSYVLAILFFIILLFSNIFIMFVILSLLLFTYLKKESL
jgi:APA family basic amino acid/polyamine antiporter